MARLDPEITSRLLRERHARIEAACERDHIHKKLLARIAELEAQRNRPQVGWEVFFRKSAQTFTKRCKKRMDYEVNAIARDLRIQLEHLFARLQKNIAHNLAVIEANSRRDIAIAETRAKLRLREKIIARILLAKDVEVAVDRGNLDEAHRRAQRLRRRAEIINRRVDLKLKPLVPSFPPKPEAPIEI